MQDEIHEGATTDHVACSQVTGLDCDYVAELDASVDRAQRGSVADQLLAQLTTHVGKEHPDNALSPTRIAGLRKQLAPER